MIIVPLGLGTKLRRLPLVTVALTVFWVAIFVVDKSQEQIADGIFNAAAKTGIRDAARSLFVEYCSVKKGASKFCQRYAVLVNPGYPAKTPLKHGDPALTIEDYKVLGKEQKQAAALRDRFTDCGESKVCFRYKDLIWNFSVARIGGARSLRQLHAYTDYLRVERRYLNEIRQMCATSQCLVSGNVNVASVFWAQARHGSLAHLLGNLFAFIIFGIYAEQRTNRFVYLAVILCAGSIGMVVHTKYFASKDAISLGGSAIVSAVMGMFYVFYFNSRMSFLVWLPRRLYWGTKYSANVRYSFPLLFVLADIAGILDSGFKSLHFVNVAHMAHITGFLSGLFAALVIVQWRRLPTSFVYEDELDDVRKLAGMRSIQKQLNFAEQILAVNPSNMRAREIACAAAIKCIPDQRASYGTKIRGEIEQFLKRHLPIFCEMNMRRGNLAAASQFVERLPFGGSYRLLLSNVGQVTLLGLINFSVQSGKSWSALRLMDVLLARYPFSRRYEILERHCADLIASLPVSARSMANVSHYLKAHADSPLTARLGAWLSNAQTTLRVA